jgi:5-hydroxyisourate hydrolase-like protein (transthyretin family)
MCLNEIKENAKICCHCGQFQKKQKDPINFSKISLVIGVIISTISLATIGINAYKKLQEPNNSDIVGRVLDYDKESFNLALSNRGNKSAVVWYLKVSYPEAHACEKEVRTFTKTINIKNQVIEANKTYNIPVYISSLNISTFTPEALADEEIKEDLKEYEVCSANLTFLDFDNIIKNKSFKFSCMPQGQCP